MLRSHLGTISEANKTQKLLCAQNALLARVHPLGRGVMAYCQLNDQGLPLVENEVANLKVNQRKLNCRSSRNISYQEAVATARSRAHSKGRWRRSHVPCVANATGW